MQKKLVIGIEWNQRGWREQHAWRSGELGPGLASRWTNASPLVEQHPVPEPSSQADMSQEELRGNFLEIWDC